MKNIVFYGEAIYSAGLRFLPSSRSQFRALNSRLSDRFSQKTGEKMTKLLKEVVRKITDRVPLTQYVM